MTSDSTGSKDRHLEIFLKAEEFTATEEIESEGVSGFCNGIL